MAISLRPQICDVTSPYVYVQKNSKNQTSEKNPVQMLLMTANVETDRQFVEFVLSENDLILHLTDWLQSHDSN